MWQLNHLHVAITFSSQSTCGNYWKWLRTSGKSTISFRISATFSSNNFLTIYNSWAWRWSILSAFCSSSSIAQTIAELHEQSTGFTGYQSGSRQIKSDAAPSTKRIPTSFTAVITIQQPNVANEESTSFSTFTWIGTTTALYFIY